MVAVDEPEEKTDGPAKCITGKSQSGICGAAAYCNMTYKCCTQCPDDCNSRCGWLEERCQPAAEPQDEKQQDDFMLTVISDTLKWTIYDFHCEDGTVTVARNIYQYEDGNMQLEDSAVYTALDWKYTAEGYIMFSGSWYSEAYYLFTLSDMQEKVALRVLPLDEKYRTLNETYMMPISYVKNNMFLVDWSEDDFSALDCCDCIILTVKYTSRSLMNHHLWCNC